MTKNNYRPPELFLLLAFELLLEPLFVPLEVLLLFEPPPEA
jgi:hypothetical protein